MGEKVFGKTKVHNQYYDYDHTNHHPNHLLNPSLINETSFFQENFLKLTSEF